MLSRWRKCPAVSSLVPIPHWRGADTKAKGASAGAQPLPPDRAPALETNGKHAHTHTATESHQSGGEKTSVKPNPPLSLALLSRKEKKIVGGKQGPPWPTGREASALGNHLSVNSCLLDLAWRQTISLRRVITITEKPFSLVSYYYNGSKLRYYLCSAFKKKNNYYYPEHMQCNINNYTTHGMVPLKPWLISSLGMLARTLRAATGVRCGPCQIRPEEDHCLRTAFQPCGLAPDKCYRWSK